MNNKLYKLMNWPAIEEIVFSGHTLREIIHYYRHSNRMQKKLPLC